MIAFVLSNGSIIISKYFNVLMNDPPKNACEYHIDVLMHMASVFRKEAPVGVMANAPAEVAG